MSAQAAKSRDFADLSSDEAIRASVRSASNVRPIWPAPDMYVLSAGRRAPAAMPQELFGSAWPLLGDLAEGAGAPVEYTALAFLSVAASLVGGKRKVQPYTGHPWAEPCVLWVGLVGDPSANKSPAIDAVTEPLRAMEKDHAAAHSNALRMWQASAERAKAEKVEWIADVKLATKDGVGTPSMPEAAVEPAAPERRRLLVGDATPEALGSILAGNPAGTLHMRDELAGWLMSFDRYSPGGRQFWLEAYGGRPYVVDRQKHDREPIIIPFNGVSVLGGIQPEKLAQALLADTDDGLVARFLWAWPEPIPYRRPRRIADVDALARLYRRLDGLAWAAASDGTDTALTLSLDSAAADLFERWAGEAQAGLDDAGTLYKGFCGKLRGTVLRLSLVAELVRWAAGDGTEPRSITAHTIGAAIDFVEEFGKPAALRVFGDAALPIAERNAATLARYLVRSGLERFNARKLRREARLPGLKEAQPMSDALACLVDADVVQEAGTRAGGTPGRQSADYIVNPAIFGGR